MKECLMKRIAYGFTILETVIALLILTFIIFSLGILIPLSQTRIQSTSHRDMAFTIADTVLEQMQTIYWERMQKSSGGETRFIGNHKFFDPDNQSLAANLYTLPVNGYPPSPYPTVSHSFYSAENSGLGILLTPHIVNYVLVVRSLYSGPNEDLLAVSVDVYWRESSGRKDLGEKKISVSTMRYKRER